MAHSTPDSSTDPPKPRVSRWSVLLLVLFVANLLLVSPDLFPLLNELNPNDEVKYIDSGRSLVSGSLRGIEWSPLSSFVYAPIYLIVQQSVDWLVWAAAIGRILLFGLLWYSAYRLGKEFNELFPPLIMVALVFVVTTAKEIVRNPSDALFASTAALALAQLFAFRKSHNLRELALGSLFMGLTALSRNDGLFLLPVFWIVSTYLATRQHRLGRSLVAAVVPIVLLVGGYLSVTAISAGEFHLGVGFRGYTAYTWSLENVLGLTPEQIGDQLAVASGTRPSVPSAVLASPALFLELVRSNVTHLPEAMLEAYGKRLATPLFYFALAGAVSLAHRRSYVTLGILLLWPLHSLIYLGFYLRPGFLLLHYYLVLVMAAMGVSWLVREVRRPRAQLLWSVPLVGLGAYGLLDHKLAIMLAGAVTLIALWVVWLGLDIAGATPSPVAAGLLVMLFAGLVLRDGYSFPNYPPVGDTPADRANQFLQRSLPRGSNIVADWPLYPIASRMAHVAWDDLGVRDADQGDGCEVLRDQDIGALFVTPETVRLHRDLWEFVQDPAQTCLGKPFVADPGSLQVFLVNTE